MAWSMPVQQGPQGWKLRVLSGTSIGMEFDLPRTRYTLGSRAPADIVIPDPSISPQHIAIELRSSFVIVTDCSGGAGMTVNGKRVPTAQVVPGDHVTAGNFKFEFSNPSYVPKSTVPTPGSLYDKFEKLSLAWRVGGIAFTIAAVLFILFATTNNPHLAPVTLIAMSAVVPAAMICWLVEKHDKTGISFYTLAITFLAGGTIGVIAAMINYIVGGIALGGLLVLPIFAGLYEEPAKFIATCWRWRQPRYDRPMDGLIIGTVSGFGFAVFETAGYGFSALESEGFASLLEVMLKRGISSPFGHGLWSGIIAAAFWQNGRDIKRAIQERSFLIACAWGIGLHALWNASGCVPDLGFGFVIVSAIFSVREYRKLLAAKGYRK